MKIHFTTAPEAYDYGYVETVDTNVAVTRSGGYSFRMIRSSDDYRFTNWQTPRYASGLYVTLDAEGFAEWLENGFAIAGPDYDPRAEAEEALREWAESEGACSACFEMSAIPGFTLCGECSADAQADEAFHANR